MEIKNKLLLQFICPRCGKFKIRPWGYYLVCDKCEIEMIKEIKENAKNENRDIDSLQ